ncbi:MAG: efflux RND transporter periplasmic adaptor subunit [Parahaliea sp.]
MMNSAQKVGYSIIGISSVLALLLTGCGRQEAAPPPEMAVSVVEAKPRDIYLFSDLVGEVRGSQEIELRARVSGVLLEKHFADGVKVEKGEPLFSIDDRDLKARVTEAESNLASAQSNLSRARLDVERYAPLVKEKAISKQVYDNAVATEKAYRAQVEAARAAVDQASLNVGFASIAAPVSGRIGAAEVDPGDLINAGTTLLATISNSDPAWVYFSVSESALLDYEKIHGVVGVAAENPNSADESIELFLSDGSKYAKKGKLNFTDRALDSTTGTYRLRAEFPNPDAALRPGMFARIRITTDILRDAMAVPDKAVSQTLDQYFLTIIDEHDQGQRKQVTLGERQEGLWVVTAGLLPGDRVVVEGLQKIRPGLPLAITVEDDSKYFDKEHVVNSKEQ